MSTINIPFLALRVLGDGLQPRTWIEQRSTLRQDKYAGVVAAADGDAPPGRMRGARSGSPIGPEVDEWIGPPASFEVVSLTQDGEDFALLDEDGQRSFLLLAAEALYGPHHDARTLALAIMEANAPI